MNSADSINTAPPDPAAPMVLHVRVVTGTGGGPEKTILNSPRFLARSGYQSRCAFLHPPDDEGIHEIARRGCRAETDIIAIPDRGPIDWRSIRELLRLCRRHRVAIWHGHDYKSNVIGLMLRRLQRMRLVTTAHGWGAIIGRVPTYNRIDMAVLPYYERVICVSRDIADRCHAANVPNERITIIENAIDLEQYQPDDSPLAARATFGVPAERFLIGAAGRLSPEKGFDRLITAVARLRDQDHNVGLVIAGDGPERPRLEALIASQREPNRYKLLGHQSDLSPLYNAIDLFALSSLSEGLPNVLLEAMAMSRTVVATRVGGVPQLIHDNEHGLLIPPDDPPALAAAIERLLRDQELRGQLGERARNLMEQKFSFANRMERIVQTYKSLGVPPSSAFDS